MSLVSFNFWPIYPPMLAVFIVMLAFFALTWSFRSCSCDLIALIVWSHLGRKEGISHTSLGIELHLHIERCNYATWVVHQSLLYLGLIWLGVIISQTNHLKQRRIVQGQHQQQSFQRLEVCIQESLYLEGLCIAIQVQRQRGKISHRKKELGMHVSFRCQEGLDRGYAWHLTTLK